jgi:hypothetical protein
MRLNCTNAKFALVARFVYGPRLHVDEVAFLVDDAPILSYAPGDTEEVRRVI